MLSSCNILVRLTYQGETSTQQVPCCSLLTLRKSIRLIKIKLLFIVLNEVAALNEKNEMMTTFMTCAVMTGSTTTMTTTTTFAFSAFLHDIHFSKELRED